MVTQRKDNGSDVKRLKLPESGHSETKGAEVKTVKVRQSWA